MNVLDSPAAINPQSVSHRPPPPAVFYLLPVFLSESAWVYLVLCSVMAATNPGVLFSPVAVLAPYGVAAVATYLLGLVRAEALGGRGALITHHPSLPSPPPL